MEDHLAGREQVIKALREELLGPCPSGNPINTSHPLEFEQKEDSYGPWIDASSGEEILQRDPPTRRYGVGVLYPRETPQDSVDDGESNLEDQESGSGEVIDSLGSQRRPSSGSDPADDDDLDLSGANDYRPSSMALTFLARPRDVATLRVRLTGGRYRPINVRVADSSRTWWLRSEVRIDVVLGIPAGGAITGTQELPVTTVEPMDECIQIRGYSRLRVDGTSLITIAVVNTAESEASNRKSLFQTRFVVIAHQHDGSGAILPYPRVRVSGPDAHEEESFELLYRKAQTFAVGHGCASDWEDSTGRESVSWVSAEVLPQYEAPSVTPDIVGDDGKPITVSMARLAGLDTSGPWLSECETLVTRYRRWLDARRADLVGLEEKHREAAERHLSLCDQAADRIVSGIELLGKDPMVAEAFRLANHAILLQQLRTGQPLRDAKLDKSGRYQTSRSSVSPSWHQARDRGGWRPFQIAFLLATLPSVANPAHPDRRQVELIWFPTGGGKTEAYLGLSAFGLFLRRLRNPEDAGTEIIMRYTLRLLTTQQFLRVGALMCAMEHLRKSRSDVLGVEPFTIGVWLGGDTTPNTRAGAKQSLRALNRYSNQPNKFLLLRCPWCSAQMGPVSKERGAPRDLPRVAGYKEQGRTVVLYCPDRFCEFSAGLPVTVIDEDVYRSPPSLVIGTVDKFALLAWKPDARAIFGIDPSGNRSASPPGLIIQDELHLIAGPLGSMVGLYEGVIETLCTDNRMSSPALPKIVCATATIRRYEEQVHALYGRERVALFPPPGLDAGDSFFARYDTDSKGRKRPGRIYIGVHGGGLGSIQTAQVRTFASLLQAPTPMNNRERDPWWTLLTFFNSLRELGTSLSLVQSDIPDYLKVLKNRYGLEYSRLRHIRTTKELTGRLSQDEIPRAIEELERTADKRGCIDICLASSIIEVGIDIDRLSLIVVFGQPKTTSQYIQVTGRIGRRHDRPGLVVTILSPSKPRDRSHFERFRSYHERLYAQVEPASVTPYAPPVLDRALHAALCAYIRQAGPDDLSPWPVPSTLIEEAAEIIRKRVRSVDSPEMRSLERALDNRRQEWTNWERTDWTSPGRYSEGSEPLLRRPGNWYPPEVRQVSWATPMSMRNVDAECVVEVTNTYAAQRGGTG